MGGLSAFEYVNIMYISRLTSPGEFVGRDIRVQGIPLSAPKSPEGVL